MFKFLSSEPIHNPLASPSPGAPTEVKTTTCYMCACRCGIRVHLRDGEIRYIDGNPEHPFISWERALAIVTEGLAKIRATDPKKLALFTGRD